MFFVVSFFDQFGILSVVRFSNLLDAGDFVRQCLICGFDSISMCVKRKDEVGDENES